MQYGYDKIKLSSIIKWPTIDGLIIPLKQWNLQHHSDLDWIVEGIMYYKIWKSDSLKMTYHNIYYNRCKINKIIDKEQTVIYTRGGEQKQRQAVE